MQCMTVNRGLFMVIEESRLRFEFPDNRTTIKFDEEKFYRNRFNKLPASKGVDFISDGKDMIAFIEVKNCSGHEGENRWRIAPNNQKRDTAHTPHETDGRDSLDIEIPQKIAMTLASLCGVYSFGNRIGLSEKLSLIAEAVCNESFSRTAKKKLVILVLEGDFETHTTPKKAIMSKLQQSIAAKMQWLDCKVSVVDSTTYNEKLFKML